MDAITVWLLGLVLAATVVYLLPPRWTRWSGKRLPPGPAGYPVLGSLASIDAKMPHLSFAKMAEEYGKDGMFSVQLGSIFTVVLTDPKIVKKTFGMDVFTGRPPLYFTMGVLQGQGMISAAEELWKDQRKVLMGWMRALGAARGSGMRPKFAARMEEMADRMENRILKENLECFDFHEIITDVLGNTVNNLVFGVSYQSDDPVWKWLVEIQEEGVKCMGVSAVLNFLPFMRFLSKSIRDMQQVMLSGQAQTHSIVEQIVKIRKRRLIEKGKISDVPNLGKPESIECTHYAVDSNKPKPKCTFDPSKLTINDDECILDFFLEEQENRKLNGDVEGLKRLSDKQLNFLLCDLFGASLDTTMNTIMWFTLMIAIHPEEQKLVRKELHEICGNNVPTLDNMADANYTKAAICEIQRLRTVVPLGVPHGAIKDTTLEGYFIPRDAMIMPFQNYMHNDPSVWDDPKSFKPSRFLNFDGSVSSPDHFMPFQIGKRMCPGDEFARMEMFIFISRLVSRFEISLAAPVENMEGDFGLTLCPPKFKLKLKPLFSCK